jgi:hypothetical protein
MGRFTEGRPGVAIAGKVSPTGAVTKPSLGLSAGTDRDWPAPLAKTAFIGPIGDLVRAVEPSTEADPAALMLQGLVLVGNAFGRTACVQVDHDRHYANEFLVVVGPTSTGRKGTGLNVVKAGVGPADPEWSAARWVSGLSSGEGVVWHVRDAVEEPVNVAKKKGDPPQFESTVTDPGIADKRLMVLESEFSQVLRQLDRQGNVLSPVLRQAWESGTIRTLTKNHPAKTTDAHVSIIAHCTPEELRKYLTDSESANGYGNRHLFAVSRRGKLLPRPVAADERAVAAAQRCIGEAVAFAKVQREVVRDAGAQALWESLYPDLSDDRGGLAGTLSARRVSHVNRLSLIYGMTERSHVIRARHLAAAVEAWDYCQRSVEFIFGESTGDRLADECLDMLRACPAGLTRTQLVDAFQRHASGDELSQSLGILLRLGKARFEPVPTGGRWAERWHAEVKP